MKISKTKNSHIQTFQHNKMKLTKKQTNSKTNPNPHTTALLFYIYINK